MKCLKQYADFSGRARRSEYWYFCLFNVLIMFAISLVLGFIAGATGSMGIISLVYVYSLAVIIPGLAVCVRRLHDVGKSGWWYFIAFVPLVGAIWLLVLFCTDSEPGANQYGPNPKE